jgi:hypothetical protein
VPSFFPNYRGLVLQPLTTYYDEADDGPVAPWVANTRIRPLSAPEWTPVLETLPRQLFPTEDLLQPSSHRPGGYAMWDFIVRNGRTSLQRSQPGSDLGGPDDLRSTRKGANSYWTRDMYKLYSVGQAHESPYVLDLFQEPEVGANLLRTAHAVAHSRIDRQLTTNQFWDTYTMNTRAFIQAVAELAFAHMFDLPINLFPKFGSTLPFGIAVRPTTRIGFTTNKPVLQEPYSTSIQADRTLVFANMAVEIGADPAAVALGCERFTPGVDWWAYQPVKIYFTGWETAAWVYGQDLAYIERIGWARTAKAAFSCSVDDLLPATCFKSAYLDQAIPQMPPDLGFQPVTNWLDPVPPDALASELLCTPPLPCVQCLGFNRLSDKGLRSAPTSWGIAHRRKIVDPELNKEMKEYRKLLRSALKWVTKAKARKYGKNYRTNSSMFRKQHAQIFAQRRAAARQRKKDRR